MPLHAVVIGERTLARGSEAQHVEWDANVRELLSKAGSQAEDVATLHVSMTEQQFLLDFRDEDDSELVTIIIPHELLSEHITEYIDIVRQIADADGVNQMEALDMAKKVTHDRAGRVLASLVAGRHHAARRHPRSPHDPLVAGIVSNPGEQLCGLALLDFFLHLLNTEIARGS
ncbi:MAG: UPF0262 family protein [Deltaproteobacteria bacterium]|nr:UPF0262 family protein [Deltaproteobacteria bacterium]